MSALPHSLELLELRVGVSHHERRNSRKFTRAAGGVEGRGVALHSHRRAHRFTYIPRNTHTHTHLPHLPHTDPRPPVTRTYGHISKHASTPLRYPPLTLHPKWCARTPSQHSRPHTKEPTGRHNCLVMEVLRAPMCEVEGRCVVAKVGAEQIELRLANDVAGPWASEREVLHQLVLYVSLVYYIYLSGCARPRATQQPFREKQWWQSRELQIKICGLPSGHMRLRSPAGRTAQPAGVADSNVSRRRCERLRGAYATTAPQSIRSSWERTPPRTCASTKALRLAGILSVRITAFNIVAVVADVQQFIAVRCCWLHALCKSQLQPASMG